MPKTMLDITSMPFSTLMGLLVGVGLALFSALLSRYFMGEEGFRRRAEVTKWRSELRKAQMSGDKKAVAKLQRKQDYMKKVESEVSIKQMKTMITMYVPFLFIIFVLAPMFGNQPVARMPEGLSIPLISYSVDYRDSEPTVTGGGPWVWTFTIGNIAEGVYECSFGRMVGDKSSNLISGGFTISSWPTSLPPPTSSNGFTMSFTPDEQAGRVVKVKIQGDTHYEEVHLDVKGPRDLVPFYGWYLLSYMTSNALLGKALKTTPGAWEEEPNA